MDTATNSPSPFLLVSSTSFCSAKTFTSSLHIFGMYPLLRTCQSLCTTHHLCRVHAKTGHAISAVSMELCLHSYKPFKRHLPFSGFFFLKIAEITFKLASLKSSGKSITSVFLYSAIPLHSFPFFLQRFRACARSIVTTEFGHVKARCF